MVEERIAYGIEKFLEEDFFLPENDSYCLEEKSESGRSELQVTIQGDNLCCEDYDHKGKCNFLKRESPLKLQRSKNAMEELEDWLSDPSELGKKPTKIEYTNAFADEDGINCLVFKYKKNLLGKCLLGIVSESGTFSEMGEYNQKMEIDDAKRILEMLKNYWKEMAKN